MRSFLVGTLLALLVGCATASPPSLISDDDVPIDAQQIDGRSTDAGIDAPTVRTISLSQTGSETPTAQSSVACTTTATGVVNENSYYRVFRLSEFGITRPFTPTMVNFGVELAGAGGGAGQQTIQVKLYTLTGGVLQLANLTPIAGNNVIVPDSGITNISVPIAPAPAPLLQDATLVAEVFIPDGTAVANVFFVGANNGSETATGYLRAPTCGIPEPVTFTSIGFPMVRLVLSVTGTY